MLRATLKSLLARKLRLLLSGLAVVLGVGFVAGAMVLTDTISRSFERGMATAYDHAEVVVTGEAVPNAPPGMPPTQLVPSSLVDELAALPQVAQVHPEVWTEGVRAIGDDGRVVSTYSAHVGSNWLDAGELLELRAGTGPTSDDEVAINAELARVGELEVGDTVGVLTREPRRDFTVVGVFGHASGRDSWFGETQIAFTDRVAQQLLLGEPDVYTEVSLNAAGGVSAQELRDVVEAAIGDDHRAMTGEEALAQIGDEIRAELSFLEDVLLAFAVVALIVGAFLVLNTFSILVAQRMRELALLRAVGASRRQVVGSVLVEAAVIGTVAATIGLALGIGIAMLLTAWLGGQLDMTPALAVPAGAIVAAYAVGLLVTVVAALLPALRASRVPPVEAMRGATAPVRSLTRLTVAGAIGTLGGGALVARGLVGPVTQATLPLTLVGVVAAFTGVALLTPALVRPVAAVIGRPFAWSAPGDLGRRNTMRQPRRTAITAAALMVGVALVTAASTFFGSFAASFGESVDARLDAQIVIAGEPTGLAPATFDRAALDRVRADADVAAAAAFWDAQVDVAGERVHVRAVDDLAAWLGMTGVAMLDGEPAVESGQIVLAERIAERQELAIGDELEVTLARGGQRRLEVVGVYERNELFEVPLLSADDAGDLGLAHPHEGFVALTDGVDVTEVRARIEALLVDSPQVLVHDRSGWVEQQTREFDEAVTFVQALLLLAMVIAVLGVVNTLVLSIVERTRELGLLRAIGLGRLAMARMVAVESVVISLFGALLGVVVGAGLGATVVWALRDEGFSQLTLPWGLMVTYLVVAAVVGVAASVIPAIRASRLDVLDAIAYE